MKKCVLALLMLGLLLSAGCGFPSTYALENIQNILIAGVDVTEDGGIRLTVVVDRVDPGGEPGKEQVTTQVYTAKGETVFDAKRNLHTYAEKRLSWYHLKYIIVGEEAAKQDIGNVLDFFCENDENRFLHQLLVAKGMSASDLILQVTATDNDFNSDLESLFRQTKQTGEASEVHLLDYAMACECEWTDFYIPALEITENVRFGAKEEEESEGNTPIAKLSGYALFREDQLVGYLDGHQAIGFNLAINDISSAELTVTDIHGHAVSLEVMMSKASIKPSLGDMPSATISVVVDTFMVEYHDTVGATSSEYIQDLELKQSEYILGLITSALQAAKSCRSDVFGIGAAFQHAYPAECKQYKDRWEDIFAEMEITIEVQSKIQCTYSMLNAPGQ